MNFLIFIFLSVFLISCESGNQHVNAGSVKNGDKKKIIALQPFLKDSFLLNQLKANLESKLNAEFKILPVQKLPATTFYKPRQRFIADSILTFLANEKPESFIKILGVTERDISINKDGVKNWGIMGLAICPGEPCVISSFRAGPTLKNKKQFIDRMTVLALHELGHTFSLPHCKKDSCIMADAEGKMKLDFTKTYCSECKIVLKQYRILR